MKRRTFLQRMSVFTALPAFSILLPIPLLANDISQQAAVKSLNKPHEAWRGSVSPEAYRILFEEHTEESGSSELNDEHREGTFICAACYLPLFESQYKYESGTGWPSFTQPIPGHIGTQHDFKLIFLRTEYHCVRCGGHQGHVFKDGPPPRGERWCNNGLTLKFVLRTDQLPDLRS
jgi:peptide-methionine (R)-S-oxide reductase